MKFFLSLILVICTLKCYGQKHYKEIVTDSIINLISEDENALLRSSKDSLPLHGTYYMTKMKWFRYYKNGKEIDLIDQIHFAHDSLRAHLLITPMKRGFPFNTINVDENHILGLEISLAELKEEPHLMLDLSFDELNRATLTEVYGGKLHMKTFHANNAVAEEKYVYTSKRKVMYHDKGQSHGEYPSVYTLVKYNDKAQLISINTYQEKGVFEIKGGDDDAPISTEYWVYTTGLGPITENPKHLLQLDFDSKGRLKNIDFYDNGLYIGSLKLRSDGSIILPFK